MKGKKLMSQHMLHVMERWEKRFSKKGMNMLVALRLVGVKKAASVVDMNKKELMGVSARLGELYQSAV